MVDKETIIKELKGLVGVTVHLKKIINDIEIKTRIIYEKIQDGDDNDKEYNK